MKNIFIIAATAAVAAGQVLPVSPSAGANNNCLKVGTKEVPPFVERVDGEFTGWSIDYFAHVFERARSDHNLPYTCYYFVEYDTTTALVDAAARNEVDVAHAAITATATREQFVDFSAGFLYTGFRVLVRIVDDAVEAIFFLARTIGGLVLNLSLLIVLLSVGGGLILLTLETVWPGYRPTFRPGMWGILDATSLTATLLFGGSARLPTGLIARPVAYTCVAASTMITALVTALTAVVLFQATETTDISSYDDLPGKQVIVPNGTTAATLLRTHGNKVTVNSIEEALDAFRDGTGDAIVYDAPVLESFANEEYLAEGTRKYTVVGALFKEQAYAMAFPIGISNVTREAIDRAIYDLDGSDTVNSIDEQYFGSAEDFATTDSGSGEQDVASLQEQIVSILFVSGVLIGVGIVLWLILGLPRMIGCCGADKKEDEWSKPPPKGHDAAETHFWRLKRKQDEVRKERLQAISYPGEDLIWECYEAITDVQQYLLLVRQSGRIDIPVGEENVPADETQAPAALSNALQRSGALAGASTGGAAPPAMPVAVGGANPITTPVQPVGPPGVMQPQAGGIPVAGFPHGPVRRG